MKNYITVAALLAAGTAFANAAYVWTGAVDSSWGTQGNWELTDGSQWNPNGGTGTGPGTTGSNMWDEIKFDGTKYTKAPTAPASLEGWNVKLNLVNGANVTLNSFAKWQTMGQPSYIKVDKTSSLTITAEEDNFGYRNEAASFEIASYEGLKLTDCVWSDAGPSPAFNINLYEQGSVWANWSLNGNIDIVFTADLKYSTTNAGQYEIKETNGQYRLVQRTLWVNQHDNGGLIDSDGHVFTLNGNTLAKSTDTLTASADSLGKYYLEKIVTSDADNTGVGGKNIVVSYVEAIPEPSAFGLLAGLGALALVASRRRRK